METKLTLSISGEVVRKARQLSKKRRKSVSVLFEEFITRQERMNLSGSEKSFIDQIASLNVPQISYAEMKNEFRKGKLRKKK